MAHQIDVARAIRAYATAADAARAAKRTADQARRTARTLMAAWSHEAGQPSLVVDGMNWGIAPSSRLVIPADRWHALYGAGRLDDAGYLAPLSVSRDRAASLMGTDEISAMTVTILGEPDLRPL